MLYGVGPAGTDSGTCALFVILIDVVVSVIVVSVSVIVIAVSVIVVSFIVIAVIVIVVLLSHEALSELSRIGLHVLEEGHRSLHNHVAFHD